MGQVAPLVAALLAIPLLISHLGVDRFGLLSIGWMLIGYFSLFDFGLGRALTQIVAERLAAGRQQEVPALMWTGLTLMTLLGLLAGAILLALSDWIIYTALKVPPALRAEAKLSIMMLAPALPFVVVATGLRGILEARQAFKLLNLVRTPLGVLTFAAPLLALPFSNSLVPVFCILTAVRVLTTVFFVQACDKAMPDFRRFEFERGLLPELLKFGGWMTVSNVVSPIMVNMDRFFIGAALSVSAVTYYTTPFEMVLRVLIVPGAIAGVCFPMFAEAAKGGDRSRSRAIFWKSTRYALLFLALTCGFIFVFADNILHIWLGAEFAAKSALVLKILAVGIVFNGLAHIPFAFVQGIGLSRVTALFHLLELVLYLPMIYMLLHLWGIAGVALAWCVRVALDAALLFWYAQKRLMAAEHV